jgi:hypothetical protein
LNPPFRRARAGMSARLRLPVGQNDETKFSSSLIEKENGRAQIKKAEENFVEA